MNKTDDYIIEGGREGKARLNILADVLYDHTKTLLEAHGVTAGTSFLDVGCGGGNVAFMVAEMTGDAGKVTAVDFDEQIILLAQKDATDRDTRNISFQVQRADEISNENEFDVSYARFLLSHVNNPAEVLLKMKQSVKPGGKVIAEDVDFNGHFCFPSCTAFDRYVHYYTTAAQHNGGNANIGPSLFALFEEAGLDEIGFDVIQPCFSNGARKWMAYETLEKIRATLVKLDIAPEQTIKNMLHELESFTKDEHTIMSLPRIFRVWGVKKQGG